MKTEKDLIEAAKKTYSRLTPFGKAIFQEVVKENEKTMVRGLAVREAFRGLFELIREHPPKLRAG